MEEIAEKRKDNSQKNLKEKQETEEDMSKMDKKNVTRNEQNMILETKEGKQKKGAEKVEQKYKKKLKDNF